jgi:pentatricopeptide repeat protein
MQFRHFLLSVLVVTGLLVPPGFAADPDRDYANGFQDLYNLDFDSSDALFRSLTDEFPDNPDYWNARASSYWLRILYTQQKLSMEAFSSKDRFGTLDSKDSVSEAEEKQLRETLDRAITLSDAMLKKDPKNIRGLYAKGISYAMLASFEGTVKRSWLSAAKKAKTARNLHKDVLKLDPNHHDARAIVGIYNYTVGSLSWGARMLVSMIGLGGDGKESGLRDLETAAEKGQRIATNAKMLLIVVYGREKQFDKALKVIDDMHAKYPRNFMLDMSKGSVYGKMNRWDQAAETYRETAEKIAAKKDGYDRMRIERVYYELANSEFQAKKFDDAARTFAMVTAGPNATPNEKANAYLWMGRIADSRKDRSNALSHYNAVLGLQADPSLKSDAQRLIRKPFVP